jgi:hypothetical protein
VPKTEEEAARIAGAVAKVFLFRHLSPAQMTSVVQVSEHISYYYTVHIIAFTLVSATCLRDSTAAA